MTHRLATNYAKNYCNRTLIVKVIAENIVTCFFWGHSVVHKFCIIVKDFLLPLEPCVAIFYSITNFCCRLMHLLLVYLVLHVKKLVGGKSFVLSRKSQGNSAR